MRKTVGILALNLMAATTAAAAPLPGFSLTSETPRFAFYTRGEKVDAARIERTVTQIEQTLGHRLQGRAEYYRYGSAQELAAGTGHYAAGVTYAQRGEVHSIEACHDHELVHLVAGQMGDPGALFQEGLAVALGNKGRWMDQPVDRTARRAPVAIATLLEGFDRLDPQLSYALAGSFVQHLIKAHGVERMAEFFRACPQGSDVRAAFARTFGMSVEQAAERWQAAL